MNQWFRESEPVRDVSIDDRAFQYGDGLFETIAIRRDEPRLWQHHMHRLARGCERLQIEMPPEPQLRRWLDSALEQSNGVTAYCAAKIIVSSGIGQRGYGRPVPGDAQTFIGVFQERPVAEKAYRQGVATILCDTRLAVNSVTAGLKTLNRLEQVLARSECVAAGSFEGLTLDADKRLACGTMSNVFIVAANTVITPSLNRCGVEGVMRQHALETLAHNGSTIDVRDVSIEELWACDEVFLTNSQFGALPVRRCGTTEWPAGPVTAGVMRQLADSGVSECAL